MNEKTAQLVRLYEKHWNTLCEISKDHPDLSAPLLISVPDDFENQERRLMVFGQQTNDWEKGDIEFLIECHRHVISGGNLNCNKKVFFQMIRKVEKVLNISPFTSIWNNLNKCDQIDKQSRNRKSPDNEIEILEKFPVIQKEIDIISPNIVIFFTGPYYDERIKKIFQDVECEELAGFTKRQFSRIHSDKLPKHSYRTYHPSYLNRSKLADKVIKALHDNIL